VNSTSCWTVQPQATAAAPVPSQTPQHHRRPDFEDSDYRQAQHDPRRRKKSWLNDFFD
jgi:Zn-finger nucleic acid-binding protein